MATLDEEEPVRDEEPDSGEKVTDPEVSRSNETENVIQEVGWLGVTTQSNHRNEAEESPLECLELHPLYIDSWIRYWRV